ncbi:MAG: hypothetical protein KF747_06780 [Nitrospira sp.]|nr:hypothetical protein [Nitrospira sp.]
MSEKIKTAWIVSIVLMFLLCLVELFSLTFLHAWDLARPYLGRPQEQLGFNQGEEQKQVFSEVMNFKHYHYKAFVEWKNTEFKGKYLNIDGDGRRVTGFEAQNPLVPTLRYFGGSTMWGYGVTDKSTIPVLIGSKVTLNAVNYAEQAYNSRQSLNVLIEHLGAIRPGDLIIFYDGVNDSHNCLRENSTNGHVRERYIEDALLKARMLEEGLAEDISVGKLLWKLYQKTNLYQLILKAKRKVLSGEMAVDDTTPGSDHFVCNDQAKAEEVANFLVTSWKAAETIAQRAGAHFACVLQPNPYTLSMQPHFYSEGLAQSSKTVYSKVREKAKGLECFVDLSELLTSDNYFDACCHVNRRGNEEIADLLISKVIGPRTKGATDVAQRLRVPYTPDR